MAFDGSRAQRYRELAREAGALADGCTIPEIKRQFELIALEYERLAVQVETGFLSP